MATKFFEAIPIDYFLEDDKKFNIREARRMRTNLPWTCILLKRVRRVVVIKYQHIGGH